MAAVTTGTRNDRRNDRVSGSLLTAACGDALGAVFEGMARVDPDLVRRRMQEPPRLLRWTDDTAMTLVLAEHLSRTGGTVDDEDALAAEFAAAWAREPGRGYGRGAATLLASIADGQAWRRAARELFAGQGSFGNGAAMRVAPVGLLPSLSFEAVAATARRTAHVTHTHPLAQDGAAVQAVAVALAVRSGQERPVDPDEVVGIVTAHATTAAFRAGLGRVPGLVRRQADPVRVAAEVGNDVTALASVPAALVAYLRHPDDPRAAIRFAICLGGDTDTIAAMTGALVGARCGAAELPPQWRHGLEAVDRLSRAAAALAALPAPA